MQRQAASLEQQQAVMQQMEAARVAAVDAHRQHMEALRQEWSLEDFLKHHPAKFDGKTSPDAADQWLKDLERIYDAKMCPAENRERFLSEYFPDSIRYAKEVEFLQLTQGGKTVTEYAERHEERRRPYDRPHHQPQKSRSFPPQQGRVRCYSCGGPHPRYACPRKEGYRRCNNCGKEGHFGRDCPNLARAATRPPVQAPQQHQGRDRGNRPQATGRVYAMTGAEATGSGNLVMGCCLIAGVSCCVLYDSGATHSFVSDSCVKRLGLPVSELQCELAVSTPASGLVTTSSLCAQCPVEVEGRRYKVNLICLPLQDLEVILGMDWLSASRVLIDCREKRLLFPDSEDLELVSPQGAVREIQSGA
ncbi:uncharacterized protein LOC114165239 [Vigna unguiculata]|uniref:uncharacterized protein LOC114165239 n=1 Tax=Vigna unguiculata TaxID=3917 RepID=UPI001016FE29|nr:uncharacterized protein LOC114165239 [Vigna unguiculata]